VRRYQRSSLVIPSDNVHIGKIAVPFVVIHPVSDEPFRPRILETDPARNECWARKKATNKHNRPHLSSATLKKGLFKLFQRSTGITHIIYNKNDPAFYLNRVGELLHSYLFDGVRPSIVGRGLNRSYLDRGGDASGEVGKEINPSSKNWYRYDIGSGFGPDALTPLIDLSP
jgi:hypothetical protein